MSLDLLAVQDQIVEKLQELPQTVFVTAVPDDEKIAYNSSNLFLPYIVVLFSDMREAPNGRGITSSRQNAGTSYCVVQVYAPTERATRQVVNLVRDKLTGYQPIDAGEMRLSGGKSYSTVETNAVPKKYVSEVAYTFIVNTVVS